MIKIGGLSVLTLLSATVLSAGSVTYTYVGDSFTAFQGTDTSGVETNLSVSFTVPSLLVDISNFVTPTSFQISDGFVTLTDQSPDIANANTEFLPADRQHGSSLHLGSWCVSDDWLRRASPDYPNLG